MDFSQTEFYSNGKKKTKSRGNFHLLSQGMHEFSLKSNGTQRNSVEIWDTEFYPNRPVNS